MKLIDHLIEQAERDRASGVKSGWAWNQMEYIRTLKKHKKQDEEQERNNQIRRTDDE